MDRESLASLLARGLSLENIARRVGKHPSTVSYWMAKYGLEAVNRDRHSARGGIERSQLEALVEQGMSITELAFELDRSKATIRRGSRSTTCKRCKHIAVNNAARFSRTHRRCR